MSAEVLVVLVVLALAVLLTLSGRVRTDLVAILVLLALAIAGVIDPRQALAGFADPAVITVAAMLVLGAGLSRTGIADLVGDQVLRFAGKGERRLVLVIMIVAAFLSSFMFAVGVVALLLPVVLDVARRLGRAPSKLLMPLAFGALLGGLTTLIGAAQNIIIDAALQDAGQEPFGMLEFTPVGLAAVALGTACMVLFGGRILPTRDMAEEARASTRNLQYSYGLGQRLAAMEVPEGSSVSGKTLAESRLGSVLGLSVLAITRDGNTKLAPSPEDTLRAGDRLLVEGRLDRLNQMRGWRHLTLDGGTWSAERLSSVEMDLAEASLRPQAELVGCTLLELGFRRRFGVNVLAIARRGEVLLDRLATRPLEAGDRLLLEGFPAKLTRLSQESDFHEYRRIDSGQAADDYRLHERLIVARIPDRSLLAGQMLAESRLGNAYDLTVLGLLREGQAKLNQDPGAEFRAGDTLLVQGRPEDLLTVQELQELDVEEVREAELPEMESDNVVLREIMLAPGSGLQGKTPREMRFRERYGMTIVAIWSQGHAYRTDLRDHPVRMGDVLLVHGSRERYEVLRRERDFISLSPADKQDMVDASRAPRAAMILAGVVAAVLVGWLPVFIAAPAGAALMVLSGCLSMDDAYHHIDWRALVLIAGMLSLGAAMKETGTATMLADVVLGPAAALGPLAVLGVLFWLSVLGAQVIPVPVVAVLVSPIALTAATDLGLEPRALLLAVLLGTTSAFLTPFGHPVNLIVMSTGGYRIADYARAGIALVLINFLLTITLVPLLFPLSGG